MAMADLETGLAFARPAVVTRRGHAPEDAVAAALHVDGVRRVVVGVPLHADGREGRQAEIARRFGERLRARGFEVDYWDERLTSWQAAEDLGGAGGEHRGRTARRSGALDSAAARVILQDYLDAQRRRSNAGSNGEKEST